jgi:hypothetical protein
VTGQRRDLRQKYPSADKMALDRYLLWVTCQAISNDRTLGGSQRFDQYSKLYCLPNEPIDKVAAPAE